MNKRPILRIALAIALITASAAERPQSIAPEHGLDEVGLQDVRLQGGFWGPRLDIHHKTTIPHVLDELEERHHAVFRLGQPRQNPDEPLAARSGMKPAPAPYTRIAGLIHD